MKIIKLGGNMMCEQFSTCQAVALLRLNGITEDMKEFIALYFYKAKEGIWKLDNNFSSDLKHRTLPRNKKKPPGGFFND